VKCQHCGYPIERVGTCQHACRYDKVTGRFNVGERSHVGCALRHHNDHHNEANPKSLASMMKGGGK